MERPQEQAPEDQVGNACDKNDRDDLDEEEDEPADDTFKEKIEHPNIFSSFQKITYV